MAIKLRPKKPIRVEPSKTTTATPSEPELEFEGNVAVNDDRPTAAQLEACANMMVLDAEGRSHPFNSLYQGEGVAPRQLIIFVRHFFCGICQEYLRTLSASITPSALLLLPTPTFITVIGCGNPSLIPMYTETTSCPFPIYADPTGSLYDTLNMTRTLNIGKKSPEYMQLSLFSAAMQSVYQVVKSGPKTALKGGDIKQVGGEFLFERGRVLWCHRMRNTRDHSEVAVLRRLLGLDERRNALRKTWSSGFGIGGIRARSDSLVPTRAKLNGEGASSSRSGGSSRGGSLKGKGDRNGDGEEDLVVKPGLVEVKTM